MLILYCSIEPLYRLMEIYEKTQMLRLQKEMWQKNIYNIEKNKAKACILYFFLKKIRKKNNDSRFSTLDIILFKIIKVSMNEFLIEP